MTAGGSRPSFARRAADCDAVILSDYAKGLLCREIVEAASICPVVFADPKPQNIGLLRGVTCVAPNVAEASTMTGIPIVDDASLERAGVRLVEMLDCRYAVITRGEHGMALFGRDGERLTDSVRRAHGLRRQRRRRYRHCGAGACAGGRRADRTGDAACKLRRRSRRREARHRDRVARRDPRAGRARDQSMTPELFFGRLLDVDEAVAWREALRAAGRKRRLYQRLLRRAARRSRGVSRVGARARRRARSSV